MQVTGMLHGAKLLQFAGFPTSEVLGPAASEGEIKDAGGKLYAHATTTCMIFPAKG